MLHSLSAPGIDGVEMTVAGLDDAWVGILTYRTVLKRNPVLPVESILADEYGERCAITLLLGHLYRPVVAYHGIATILERHGIETTVVVWYIRKFQFAPCLTIVG